MCGLVALLSPGEPVDPAILQRMRDRLLHRGPDNGDAWIHPGGRLGFAFRRLSIIDRSHAADQPMHAADGKLTIVYNGEIYNYVELREELKADGFSFRSASDTEVLLAAYQKWGTDCLSRLNGMFAFVIWDSVRNELFVARDRFGEKPLYIGRGAGGAVAIASEMKAILAHPAFSDAVSEQALSSFSAGSWYEDRELTFFEHIERLPPAHAVRLNIEGHELARWRYWTPDYEAINEDILPGEAVERFTELLTRSVRMRLRSDVAVGSSLSGGIDSSMIVGLLAKERDKGHFEQNTFSACFDADPTISEGDEVDKVVAFTGVHSHRVNPTPQALMNESRRLHWHQEEPFLSASIYLQWCVARLAKEQETTVLLDGQGADELLGGYQYWFKSYQLDLLDRGRVGAALWETMLFSARLRKTAWRYRNSARRFNVKTAYSLPELLVLAHKPPQVWHYPYETGVAKPVPGQRLRRTMSEALQYNSLPMLLRYADRNAMAFSRESRMPFLDYDLVDFCIGLPDRLFEHKGWQKWILRQAAGPFMPPSIRWRADKVGYAAPLDLWLRDELKTWAYERAFDPVLATVEGYDAKALHILWDQHQRGEANHSWAIWRWISLAEWLDMRKQGCWRQDMS